MCGIAGFIQIDDRWSSQDMDAMSRRIAHRGPDNEGQAHWLGVSLAHRRLSILDLSEAAHQPMVSHDERWALVYNGEIYNYRELRKELSVYGHRFDSSGDTQVLLKALIQWGTGALQKLRGMFAFALLDRREGTLLLGRDPFGIKPLYYFQDATGLAFASEIKSLLELPGVQRRAEPDMVREYLFKGLVGHGDRTMFSGIQRLRPGSWMRVALGEPGIPHLHQYWQPRIEKPTDLSFGEAADRLRDLLIESVELHLRSDVEVGAALSGGIDSSAIVCLMRQLRAGALDLHSFSYLADDPEIDERQWVDLVSVAAATQAHHVSADSQQMVAELDELIRLQDEPFGSMSIYAQHRVFALCRAAGIKVALDGQGADELFAGYRLYLPVRVAAAARRGHWRRAAAMACRATQLGDVSGAALMRDMLYYMMPESVQRWVLRRLEPRWLNRHWFAERNGESTSAEDHYPPRAKSLRHMLLLDLTNYRLPHLLRYEDRNSMAHSVESRVPFLNVPIAEFALSLPDQYLMDDRLTSKAVLRRALRGTVPDQVLDRRNKIGFATPDRQWLTTLDQWVRAVLGSDAAVEVKAIDRTRAQAQWDAIAAGRMPYDRSCWRWINLIQWARLYEVRFD